MRPLAITGAVLFGSCANLLGIDGDVTRGGLDGAGGASSTRDAGERRDSALDTDGRAAATGGTHGSVEAGLDEDCMPGEYAGTFDGRHKPSYTVVAVPLPLSGDIHFRLEPAGPGRLRIVGSQVTGSVGISPVVTSMSGTLSGDIDCVTRELLEGAFDGLIAPNVALQGPLEGALQGTTLAGSWYAKEVQNPAFDGDATFVLQRVGP